MVAVPSIGRASLLEPQPVAPEATATRGLYERHAGRIHGYCLHQLGSREEAEDAVQTTFMNAFRALGKGVVPEAEAAWLFKIAENVCLSRRRSSWRRNRVESPADFDVIEEIVPGANRQRDELIGIEDALAAMPEQQRRAILLREWQGLSYREISAELELSQSAVETLIFRARRSLARGLTEPETVKPRPESRRKGLRRALHLADLTTLLGAAKSLLTGAAALKATTAAVVVTAAAGTAVTVSSDRLDPPPKPPLAVAATSPVPVAVAAPVATAPSMPTLVSAVPAAVVVNSVAREPSVAAPRKAKVVRAEKKENGKAAGSERKRGRPILPLPAEVERPAAIESRKHDRKADRVERRAERQADKAERRADRAEVRAQRQIDKAERQAQREQRRAEGRASRAQARNARRSEAVVAAAPIVAEAEAQNDERGQVTDEDGEKRTGKQGRRRG